jgi:hypothetical protein
MAVRVLAENGLVRCTQKRSEVVKLLSHVETRVNAIEEKKKKLLDELQFTVDMILRAGHDTNPNPRSVDDDTDVKSEVETAEDSKAVEVESDRDNNAPAVAGGKFGTELCDATCGRQYHFTARCCTAAHSLVLGEADVSYVVCGGGGDAIPTDGGNTGIGGVVIPTDGGNSGIYLVKCSAFSALGRMYVVRSSDYRKCDRVLASAGLDVAEQFLYEDWSPGSSEKPVCANIPS